MIEIQIKTIEFLRRYYTPQKLISEGCQLATYWGFKPSLINPYGTKYHNTDIYNIVAIVAVLKCDKEIHIDNDGLDIFQLGMLFKDIPIEDYLNLMEEFGVIFHTIDSRRIFMNNKIYHIKFY